MTLEHALPPYALGADDGERVRFGDVEVVVKASADSTGGAFTIFEENEPGNTRLHVHEHEDEVFYVLEGEHVFQVGDQEFRAGPGGLVFAPRGVPHAQRRVLPRTGRILVLASPAGIRGILPAPCRGTRPRRCYRAGQLCERVQEIRHHLAGLASPASDFARVAAVHHGAQSATAWDDQEESERRGDSCPLRPAIAVVRARPDNVLVGRPEREPGAVVTRLPLRRKRDFLTTVCRFKSAGRIRRDDQRAAFSNSGAR